MHYEWRFERLIRYAARPAVATERLSALPDGRLLYRLKRSWRDGTNAVIFERQDFMAKLAVLVPAPRAHLTRYHGVVGPSAKWRPQIIPTGDEISSETPLNAPRSSQPSTAPTAPVMDAEPAPQTASPHKRNYTWAELMKRVFNHSTNYIRRRGNVHSRPDYTSISSPIRTGNRLRRSAA